MTSSISSAASQNDRNSSKSSEVHIIFHFSNCLLGCVGCLVAILGLSYLVRFVGMQRYFPNDAYPEQMMLTVLGIGLIAVAFLGAVAVLLERRLLLIVYLVLQTLLACAQIACAVQYIGTTRMQYRADLERYLRQFWLDREGLRNFWRQTQGYWQCCGLKEPSDWWQMWSLGNGTIFQLPMSCCDNRWCLVCNVGRAWKAGCEEKILTFAEIPVWMAFLLLVALLLQAACMAAISFM